MLSMAHPLTRLLTPDWEELVFHSSVTASAVDPGGNWDRPVCVVVGGASGLQLLRTPPSPPQPAGPEGSSQPTLLAYVLRLLTHSIARSPDSLPPHTSLPLAVSPRRRPGFNTRPSASTSLCSSLANKHTVTASCLSRVFGLPQPLRY